MLNEISICVTGSSHHCYIFWIKEGRGTFLLDDQEISIAKDTVYCFFGGQYPFIVNTCGLRGHILSFPIESFRQVKNNMNLHFSHRLIDKYPVAAVHFPGPDNLEIEHLLCSMSNVQKEESEYKEDILISLLKIFLIRLIQKMLGSGTSRLSHLEKDTLVNKFIGMVQEHFFTIKKVADYAGILCIDPSYLNTRVKAVTGITASALIKEIIITEAKKQVWQKGLSMKEIAYHLGYEDTSHFSKFFKKVAGANFSSFKKSIPGD